MKDQYHVAQIELWEIALQYPCTLYSKEMRVLFEQFIFSRQLIDMSLTTDCIHRPTYGNIRCITTLTLRLLSNCYYEKAMAALKEVRKRSTSRLLLSDLASVSLFVALSLFRTRVLSSSRILCSMAMEVTGEAR